MSAISRLSDVLLPGDHFQDFTSLIANKEENSISEFVQEFFKEYGEDTETTTKLLGITVKYYNDTISNNGSPKVANKFNMINQMVAGNVTSIYSVNDKKSTFKAALLHIVDDVTRFPNSLARPHRTGRAGFHPEENFEELIKLFSGKDARTFLIELLNESTIKELVKINNVIRSFENIYRQEFRGIWSSNINENRVKKTYGLDSEQFDNLVNFFSNEFFNTLYKTETELQARIDRKTKMLTAAFRSEVENDDGAGLIKTQAELVGIYIQVCKKFEIDEEEISFITKNIDFVEMNKSIPIEISAALGMDPLNKYLQFEVTVKFMEYIANKYGAETVILKDYKFG